MIEDKSASWALGLDTDDIWELLQVSRQESDEMTFVFEEGNQHYDF